jgi:hypothetical protein
MERMVRNTLNKKIKIILWAVCLLLTVPAAGDYELSWRTIDGGGGTSTGGTYIIRGTIGQPDAAYSEGGSYELLGGFWPGEPLCTVNFKDYAAFANFWFLSGSGMDADLYQDDTIDYRDLKVIADYWLCYCPYGWPLK